MKSHIESADPLSLEAIDALLQHREEDLYVDYKEDFEPKNEKHWLGLTADVIAFSNNLGGYIVFGVKDQDFSVVGLSDEVRKTLADTTMVLQKVNRHVRPPFIGIRTKAIDWRGHQLVIWYMPESKGQTHIVVKEGKFRMQNQEWKHILRPGMIFIRRSATNHVVEPEDLDRIIDRRIEYMKEDLLKKIAKVVTAPATQEVLLFDPTAASADNRTFVISDAPEAVAIKGLSFTVSPKTDIEELASWSALSGRDPAFRPRQERLWTLYADRKDLHPHHDQLLELIRFSLACEAPIFYWIRRQDSNAIEPLLLRAMSDAQTLNEKANILHIAAFLGRGFFSTLKRKMGKSTQHLDPRSKKFPEQGPRVYFHPELLGFISRRKSTTPEEQVRKELETELDSIASELSKGKGDHHKKAKAKAIDCFLYAREDGYKPA